MLWVGDGRIYSSKTKTKGYTYVFSSTYSYHKYDHDNGMAAADHDHDEILWGFKNHRERIECVHSSRQELFI